MWLRTPQCSRQPQPREELIIRPQTVAARWRPNRIRRLRQVRPGKASCWAAGRACSQDGVGEPQPVVGFGVSGVSGVSVVSGVTSWS